MMLAFMQLIFQIRVLKLQNIPLALTGVVRIIGTEHRLIAAAASYVINSIFLIRIPTWTINPVWLSLVKV
jgi:hypothetical protein